MDTNKPGWKSTEFWLSLIALLVGVLIASDAIPVESAIGKVLAFLGSALAALGYSVSRGLAKKGEVAATKLVAAKKTSDPT